MCRIDNVINNFQNTADIWLESNDKKLNNQFLKESKCIEQEYLDYLRKATTSLLHTRIKILNLRMRPLELVK